MPHVELKKKAAETRTVRTGSNFDSSGPISSYFYIFRQQKSPKNPETLLVLRKSILPDGSTVLLCGLLLPCKS